MRVVACFVAVLAAMPCTAVLAQSSAATATAPAAAAKVAYSTSDTEIGTLLDDPAARAIVDKHIPGFSAGEQIDMARGLTLKAIQQYSGDKITDQVLADIDSDFAKLAAAKK